MLRFSRANNIDLIQLPSHSSYLTQPLDVCVFGIFKRKITDILGNFAREHGLMVLVKHDMAAIVREASGLYRTYHGVFRGRGDFPVDMTRGITRLTGRGTKRKERAFDRPPLVDLLVLVSNEEIAGNLGHRVASHTVTGLSVNKMFFGEYIKERERVVQRKIVRSAQRLTKGGYSRTPR